MTQTNTVNMLFTEKFRPKDLDQLIAPDRIKNELNKGLVQNLLLYGSSGTGKCVDENTIITLRNKKTNEIIDISFKDFMVLMEKEK